MIPGQAENELLDGAAQPMLADMAVERELAQVADLLARLFGLGAALTGGGVFLLTDYTLGPPFRFAVVLLLVATICAVQGMQAGSRAAGQLLPEQHREWQRQLYKKKEWWLHRGQTAMLGGLGLAVAGMLLR